MQDARALSTRAAREYVELGLSPIPIGSDKRPRGPWKEFQQHRPTLEDVSRLFGNGHAGVALIAGQVSGGLEVVDVDCKYDLTGKLWQDFASLIKEHDIDLFRKLVFARTVNGGYHIFYRCSEIQGNQKLAQRPATESETADRPDARVKDLIETRGEGGYVAAAPTSGYEFIKGTPADIPTITAEERSLILGIARSFDQLSALKDSINPEGHGQTNDGRLSPGQDYNSRGDVISLLEKHGWTVVSEQGERVFLRRPGNTDKKVSANYHRGLKTLFVFSTSTDFEPQKSYSPVAVYAQLEHGGDFKTAYRELAKQGYGLPAETSNHVSPSDQGQPETEISKADEAPGLLIVKEVNEWIEEASRRPAPRRLFGDLICEGELTFLFGGTGLGKSILAVQVGDSISSGTQILQLEMEGEPQEVLYLDFELSDKQFEKRYSDDYTNHYKFSDLFKRAEINRNCRIPENMGFHGWLMTSIEAYVKTYGIKVLIVDNVTALKSATETAKDALPLMKDLNDLKAKYGLTMLVLGHTPKRDMSRPITVNDLQGSMVLSNLADATFAVGRSVKDKQIRYIKQIKARNVEEIYTSDNVIVCELVKKGNFLGFDFVEFGKESDHLAELENISGGARSREAEDFLAEILSKAPKSQDEIVAAAEQRGIKSSTLRRAKESLGVKSKKSQFTGKWFWELQGAQNNREDDQ